MKTAYNPETGKAVRLDGSEWVDTEVATNPKTGDIAIWNGTDWAIREVKPEMSGLEKASAAATSFADGVLGVGDEAGAVGVGLGSALYDMLNSDKSASEIWEDSFNWDRNITQVRDQRDRLAEEDPTLSNVAYGAGMVAGLGLPIGAVGKGASIKRAAGVSAGTGAGYGFLAGEEAEGRLEGAAMGGALGGALGGGVAAGARKLSDIRADRLAKAEEEADAVLEEADKLLFEATDADDANKFMEGLESISMGVSDAIRRRVSEGVGLRVQRADETAMRLNNLDQKKYIQNDAMQNVIAHVDENEQFKGALLDHAAGVVPLNKLTDIVRRDLGDAEAEAFAKYMRWSEVENTKFNKRLGDSSITGDNYLHTQKVRGIPDKAKKEIKEAEGFSGELKDSEGLDEMLNYTKDKAELDRTRGLYSKGEVRVDEYANPIITNLMRIQSNKRLLEIQNKFGIKDLSGGAPQLMAALEKAIQKGDISPKQARDARNAIVKLLKGQNRHSHALIKTYQNLAYGGTLAGPQTSVLNIHDLPVAGFMNGMKNMLTMYNKNNRAASDLKRLGIDNQTMGEFTKDLARSFKGASSKAEKAAAATGAGVKYLFEGVGFGLLDRAGKRGVLGTVANRLKDEASKGEFTGVFSSGFSKNEQKQLRNALNNSGGDINKMSKKDLKLFDEAITLGLGQQQLISAAGRPEKWLNNPNFRPLWMMRGFAIKQNYMLVDKVLAELQRGNTKAAAANAAKFIAVPGASYAALNEGRKELFKEDYDSSPESFMYSLLDGVLGPVTFNTVSVGSEYQRAQYEQDFWKTMALGFMPPGGVAENTVNAVTKALMKGDVEELEAILTDMPAYKQFKEVINKM